MKNDDDGEIMVQEMQGHNQMQDDHVTVPQELLNNEMMAMDSDEEFNKIEQRISAKVLEEK